MEDIAAGAEQGFLLPIAGKDGEWANENKRIFERRAREGDESMKDLVKEFRRGFGTARVRGSKL
jgi:hypothetical protein